MIEFDVETTGLQWYRDEVFLVQFYDGHIVQVFEHPKDSGRIQNWLQQADDYRAWNAKFDLSFLKAAGYELPPEERWHDGMLLAQLTDERTSAALKARGAAMFDQDERDLEGKVKAWLKEENARRRKAAKAEGTEYIPANYSDVDRELMREYATQDVLLQRRVCDQLEPRLPEELKEVYEMERGVLRALFAAEQRGIPVNRAAAISYERWLAERLETAHERCVELAGIDTFNPGSSKQIVEALNRRGADTTFMRQTKTGVSADEESLAAVEDELADAILKFRDLSKQFGTYVRPMLHPTESGGILRGPLLGSDDRLHPNFRQIGARTGRMSCAEPNIQNWHRDNLNLRSLVRAEPGHKLVACDLDSIEFRLFAAYTGAGRMHEAVLEGDVHQMTADLLGLKDRKRSDGSTETARQQGKVFNFSVLYGAGVRSIRRYFGVDQRKAKEMLDRYHAAYPEVGNLQRQVEYTLLDQGYVKSRWGRRFRSNNASQEAYKFVNYIVQGTAADLLKDSLVRIHDAGVPVVACVHDEIIAHVPEQEAAEAATLLEELMTDHPRITEHVPLAATSEVLDRWSDAKNPDFVPDYQEAI